MAVDLTVALDRLFNDDKFREHMRVAVWHGAKKSTNEFGCWLRMIGRIPPDMPGTEIPATASVVVADGREGKPAEIEYPETAPTYAIAQVHTHPGALDPKPSRASADGKRGDAACATKWKIPVYVLSDREVWRVSPGAQEPVKVCVDWLPDPLRNLLR